MADEFSEVDLFSDPRQWIAEAEAAFDRIDRTEITGRLRLLDHGQLIDEYGWKPVTMRRDRFIQEYGRCVWIWVSAHEVSWPAVKKRAYIDGIEFEVIRLSFRGPTGSSLHLPRGSAPMFHAGALTITDHHSLLDSRFTDEGSSE